MVGIFEHPLPAARMRRQSCEQRGVRGRTDIDIVGAMQSIPLSLEVSKFASLLREVNFDFCGITTSSESCLHKTPVASQEHLAFPVAGQFNRRVRLRASRRRGYKHRDGQQNAGGKLPELIHRMNHTT